MEDVTDLPKITERLLKLGFSQNQLTAFWGGNALRVLKAAQDGKKPG
jgi:membrane dipeptidase